MNNVKKSIGWADYTINPVFGCTAGCYYCYAKRLSHRLKHLCHLCGKFIPHPHLERLKEIEKIKKPSKIFVGSCTDLWDINVKEEWIYQIFKTISTGPYNKHKYYFLTKQPQNIIQSSLLSYIFISTSFLIGVTITSNDDFYRWVSLSGYKFIKNKFLSIEPILSKIDIDKLNKLFILYGYPELIILGSLTQCDRTSMKISQNFAKEFCKNYKELKIKSPLFVKKNTRLPRLRNNKLLKMDFHRNNEEVI